MNNYRISALYSGSGGNCTYIEAAGTAILVDAGKSARTLCSALKNIGSDISRIGAIFITHEHNDHISALEVLTKKYHIPIHIAEPSAAKLERDPSSAVCSCLVRHPPQYTADIGGIHAVSFITPHDSMMSVGYRFEFTDTCGKRRFIGVATDIGYVSNEVKDGLTGCEAVVLEANHDIDMLKSGPYPYDLKKRVMSRRGHLSNRESAEFASYLVAHGTRAFLLAHLSAENNRPEIALDEFTSAIADPRIKVTVALPDEPSELTLPDDTEKEDSELLNAFSKTYHCRNS